MNLSIYKYAKKKFKKVKSLLEIYFDPFKLNKFRLQKI